MMSLLSFSKNSNLFTHRRIMLLLCLSLKNVRKIYMSNIDKKDFKWSYEAHCNNSNSVLKPMLVIAGGGIITTSSLFVNLISDKIYFVSNTWVFEAANSIKNAFLCFLLSLISLMVTMCLTYFSNRFLLEDKVNIWWVRGSIITGLTAFVLIVVGLLMVLPIFNIKM